MTAFTAIIARDIRLALRAGGGGVHGVAFFALAVLAFAIAVGPEPLQLARIAAPAIWTSALLASIVSFDRILQADYEDGSLDVLIETDAMLSVIALAKAVAHWIVSLLPLVIATPIAGLMLGLPAKTLTPLLISLLIGAPSLSLIGVLAAALTLSLRRASVLMAILTAPLFVPTIIFGVAAADSARSTSALLFLGAVSLISLAVAPVAAAAAIRFNMD